MKATVYLEAMASFTAQVEIPDGIEGHEERVTAAIDAVHAMGFPQLCAKCSGCHARWSKSESEWQPTADPVWFGDDTR